MNRTICKYNIYNTMLRIHCIEGFFPFQDTQVEKKDIILIFSKNSIPLPLAIANVVTIILVSSELTLLDGAG